MNIKFERLVKKFLSLAVRHFTVTIIAVAFVASSVFAFLLPEKISFSDRQAEIPPEKFEQAVLEFYSALLSEGEKSLALKQTATAKTISVAADFFGLRNEAKDILKRSGGR